MIATRLSVKNCTYGCTFYDYSSWKKAYLDEFMNGTREIISRRYSGEIHSLTYFHHYCIILVSSHNFSWFVLIHQFSCEIYGDLEFQRKLHPKITSMEKFHYRKVPRVRTCHVLLYLHGLSSTRYKMLNRYSRIYQKILTITWYPFTFDI